MTKVYIIESEVGWGTRVDQTKEFLTEEEARTFCKQYNNEYNSKDHAPDWYMYARMENQEEYGMIHS